MTSTSASLLHSGVLFSCSNCDELTALVELPAVSKTELLVFSLETIEETVDVDVDVEKGIREEEDDDGDDEAEADLKGDVKETGL